MLFKLLQPPVIIIGMHRSGTSILAQVLEEAGIFMGADFTAYHESNYFQRLNDELLRASGGSWDKPVTTKLEPRVERRFFISEYTFFPREPYYFILLMLQRKWGWKDPRNTFTVESWQQIFPRLKVIHIIRNGVDAAISLFERNNTFEKEHTWYSPHLASPETCFDLWEQYVNEGQHWKGKLGNNYHEVRYEDLLVKSPESISSLERFTGIKISKTALGLIKNQEKNKSALPAYRQLNDYANQNPLFRKLNYATS